MKLIVGLGNPGKQYFNSRHNIGFTVVESLLEGEKVKVNVPDLIGELYRLGPNALVLKPTSYMNNSGTETAKVTNFFKITESDILVVHDEADLPLGEVKLEQSRGSAGHRGVESIISSLGTKDFFRLRVGVGRPPENIPTDQYVLEDFTATEHIELSKIKEVAHNQILEWLK